MRGLDEQSGDAMAEARARETKVKFSVTGLPSELRPSQNLPLFQPSTIWKAP